MLSVGKDRFGLVRLSPYRVSLGCMNERECCEFCMSESEREESWWRFVRPKLVRAIAILGIVKSLVELTVFFASLMT